MTDVYPPDCGGSGWSTHALASVLAVNGHDVEVITVDQSAVGVNTREYDRIRVTDVGVRTSRTLRRRLGARDYTYAQMADYLDGRLRAEPDVDILHGQHLHSGPPVVEVGRVHARATVTTVRDYWPVCLHGTSWWGGSNCEGCTTANLTHCMMEAWRWPSPVARAMVGWGRRRLKARADGLVVADRILVVSDAVRQRIEASLPEAELSVVPNIVDPDVVGSDALPLDENVDAPYLLTAGKLQPTKGFDLLLGALGKIKPDLPLLVAGDGPARSALEAQAAGTGVNARFLGWLDHGHLLSLQRGAQAVLLPSAWQEPLSRLVLETMALGTPVIAWASGGTPEIIESGLNGWLVTRRSDLQTALADLGVSGRREAIGRAALSRVREAYSPAAVYPAVVAAYSAAIEKVRPRRKNGSSHSV